MKKNFGFILLPTLIFMQLFALIGIYNLQFAFLTVKNNQQQLEKIHLVYALQVIMQRIENNLQNLSSCNIPVIPPVQLEAKPSTWWRAFACSGNLRQIRYYYVAESLGKDLCATTNKEDAHARVVKFFRITVLASFQNLEYSSHFLLQNTIVHLSKESAVCKDKPTFYKLGMQMQRFL